MGIIEKFIRDYCRAVCPESEDSQNKLFDKLTRKELKPPSFEKMLREIKKEPKRKN